MVESPSPSDATVAGGRSSRRLPFGATTALVALVCALPVLFFDDLEGDVGTALGFDGGPEALLVVLVVFAFAWALGAALLAAFSPRPAREGLLAGGIVAALITAILVAAALERGDVVIALLLAPIFGGLALALGALAGNLAQRWADGGRASRMSRGAAIASFAAGLAIILFSIPIMGPRGLDPRWPLGLAVWSFGGLLLAGGLWGLARSRQRRDGLG